MDSRIVSQFFPCLIVTKQLSAWRTPASALKPLLLPHTLSHTLTPKIFPLSLFLQTFQHISIFALMNCIFAFNFSSRTLLSSIFPKIPKYFVLIGQRVEEKTHKWWSRSDREAEELTTRKNSNKCCPCYNKCTMLLSWPLHQLTDPRAAVHSCGRFLPPPPRCDRIWPLHRETPFRITLFVANHIPLCHFQIIPQPTEGNKNKSRERGGLIKIENFLNPASIYFIEWRCFRNALRNRYLEQRFS